MNLLFRSTKFDFIRKIKNCIMSEEERKQILINASLHRQMAYKRTKKKNTSPRIVFLRSLFSLGEHVKKKKTNWNAKILLHRRPNNAIVFSFSNVFFFLLLQKIRKRFTSTARRTHFSVHERTEKIHRICQEYFRRRREEKAGRNLITIIMLLLLISDWPWVTAEWYCTLPLGV